MTCLSNLKDIVSCQIYIAAVEISCELNWLKTREVLLQLSMGLCFFVTTLKRKGAIKLISHLQKEISMLLNNIEARQLLILALDTGVCV